MVTSFQRGQREGVGEELYRGQTPQTGPQLGDRGQHQRGYTRLMAGTLDLT